MNEWEPEKSLFQQDIEAIGLILYLFLCPLFLTYILLTYLNLSAWKEGQVLLGFFSYFIIFVALIRIMKEMGY